MRHDRASSWPRVGLLLLVTLLALIFWLSLRSFNSPAPEADDVGSAESTEGARESRYREPAAVVTRPFEGRRGRGSLRLHGQLSGELPDDLGGTATWGQFVPHAHGELGTLGAVQAWHQGRSFAVGHEWRAEETEDGELRLTVELDLDKVTTGTFYFGFVGVQGGMEWPVGQKASSPRCERRIRSELCISLPGYTQNVAGLHPLHSDGWTPAAREFSVQGEQLVVSGPVMTPVMIASIWGPAARARKGVAFIGPLDQGGLIGSLTPTIELPLECKEILTGEPARGSVAGATQLLSEGVGLYALSWRTPGSHSQVLDLLPEGPVRVQVEASGFHTVSGHLGSPLNPVMHLARMQPTAGVLVVPFIDGQVVRECTLGIWVEGSGMVSAGNSRGSEDGVVTVSPFDPKSSNALISEERNAPVQSLIVDQADGVLGAVVDLGESDSSDRIISIKLQSVQLKLKVIDAQTGTPVSGQGLDLSLRVGPRRPIGAQRNAQQASLLEFGTRSLTTDSVGIASLTGVAGSSYRVALQGERGPVWFVEVPRGVKEHEFTIHLESKQEVVAQLRGADAAQFAGKNVLLTVLRGALRSTEMAVVNSSGVVRWIVRKGADSLRARFIDPRLKFRMTRASGALNYGMNTVWVEPLKSATVRVDYSGKLLVVGIGQDGRAILSGSTFTPECHGSLRLRYPHSVVSFCVIAKGFLPAVVPSQTIEDSIDLYPGISGTIRTEGSECSTVEITPVEIDLSELGKYHLIDLSLLRGLSFTLHTKHGGDHRLNGLAYGTYELIARNQQGDVVKKVRRKAGQSGFLWRL